ncbi:LppX_LprAFG lipoprotein [Streptomyces sp. NPDC058401]|uniref:LppX_LprAFG lipoprotein n=1 Tax=Streptomyces sp. NPDC058401 TaxID=3346480 RepID=UPI003667F83A
MKASAEPAPDHAGTVRAAAEATRATSARTSQTMEIGDGSKTYTLTATGDFDMAGDKGALSVDLPGGGISHVDQVFADGKVYVRGAGGMDKDTWASIARDKAETHYALRAPLNDPEHVLEQVSALTKVTKAGEQDLGGVPTVHYRGTLPFQATAARLASDKRALFEELQAKIGGEVPVSAEVWVDGQGRLVQSRMTLALGPAKSVTTVAFTELGKPVRVEVPAARDTEPVTTITGVLAG